MVSGARPTALDDEQLIATVGRSLRELAIPWLERSGAQEFLLAELKSCLSMLEFTGRGLVVRQAARAAADEAMAILYESRPQGSAWASLEPNSTGAFLARARREPSELSVADRLLADRVRQVLRERLRVEIASRLAAP